MNPIKIVEELIKVKEELYETKKKIEFSVRQIDYLASELVQYLKDKKVIEIKDLSNDKYRT